LKQLPPWRHNSSHSSTEGSELGPSPSYSPAPESGSSTIGISPQIEHRMFSFMSLNWRGRPLESIELIINLIAGTTTNTGLQLYAQLDDRNYERGIEVTDAQLATVKITRDHFHGDWNYTITPSVIQS
jgi:hypothetical protein